MRSFVALGLPEAFADEVAALSRCLSAVCEGRFVRPGNHHLTLAFLGEVGEAEARRAMDTLDAACAGAGSGCLPPFTSATMHAMMRTRSTTPSSTMSAPAILRGLTLSWNSTAPQTIPQSTVTARLA